MKKAKSIIQALGVLTLSASLPVLQGQAPSASIEQQLRSQYQLTRVGANGNVVGQPGSVIEMQDDGLIAIPASFGAYWYNTWKKGGRIKANAIQHVGKGFSEAVNSKRPFQVGEKMYLTTLEVTPTEIVFEVQSCSACDLSVNPNDPPYRARLAFQFDKGYLSTADSKQILEAVGRVFAVDSSTPPPKRDTGRSEGPKLPATYVSAQVAADYLQLNTDNTFSLQAAGETYQGTFTVSGSAVELNMSDGTKSTATIQGNSLTDSNGQAWLLQEQSAGTASSGAALQNEDVSKMVKAGLGDDLIIAKIGSSKCQFDTSTDALIKLKQSGVSAAVLKAIMGAGK
jgi:hypothetical protein